MGGDASGAPSGGYSGERFTTKFNLHDLDGLKGMLDGASVQQVRDVAQHWQDLHDQLVGPGDGGGGIQKTFDDAVKKVLEHWHGDTADRFRKRAEQISANFKAGAPYASHAAKVMHQTAEDLSTAVSKVSPVHDGWNWGDDVWDQLDSDTVDDDDLNDALKAGADTKQVLELNKENLTGHQKKRLQAAAAMEDLGTSYVVRASSLKPPPIGNREDKIPEHNGGGDGGVGTMPMPFPTGGMGGGGGGGGAGGGAGSGGGVKIPTRGMKAAPMPKTPESPQTPGISGGMGSMKPKVPGPDVTTGLDGAHSGGPGGTGGPGVKIPGGGGGGGAGVHMPSGGGGGGTGVNVPAGGGLGMPGGKGGISGASGPKGGSSGLKGGASGLKGGASGLKGGASGPGGAGARTGKPGMPGMGGAHGGAGKGAGGGRAGVSTGGGAQARQKGGLVGSTGGKASGGGQGGSGLHRSRGGTAAGTGSGSGGRRPAGMMGGAHGAHGGKGEGKGQDGNRPDYLVEEEETWTPERNVAPRVIE
ncbi:hypothetical protein [Streptomyces natalensis]|uniref:PPE family domain-containing protein n=1 Tax=Streptomyces natalensis ATCC 27448 TaxID=1240678 RepID=A0A0D7CCR9_9ACTN|nr:hypothetical protein [Streptomyces natalensis]KIZ13816.1 hypothetical protein SNA_32255 [Streptomyces natalensis ATCC 27448]